MDLQERLNKIGESIKILNQEEKDAHQAKLDLFKEQNILLANFIIENELLKDTVWLLSEGSHRLNWEGTSEQATVLVSKLPKAYAFSYDSVSDYDDADWEELDPSKNKKSFSKDSMIYYALDLHDEVSISFDGSIKDINVQLRFNPDHLSGLIRFAYLFKIKINMVNVTKLLDKLKRRMVSLEKLDHIFGSHKV